MASRNISLQLPGHELALDKGHLASGFLRSDDLLVVPRVDASILQDDGPYLAVVVHLDDSTPPKIAGVERIRCSCREVLSIGEFCYASFQLEEASKRLDGEPEVGGADAQDLLTSTQDELWQDPKSVLEKIEPSPRFGTAFRVAHNVGADPSDGTSLCRWLRCC